MAKPKVVECGRLSGSGATITEAKADLAAKVETALTGNYHPVIVSYGAYSAVVYRHPEGWAYKMNEISKITQPGIYDIEHGGEYPTKDEAIQAAAFHVIDLGNEEGIHADADIPAWLTHKSKRQTVLSNARFRRAYRHAKNNIIGLKEQEIHQWAGDHARDEQFA